MLTSNCWSLKQNIHLFLFLLLALVWLLLGAVGETTFYFRLSENVEGLLLADVKRLFTLFGSISYSFFPDFIIGTWASSLHLSIWSNCLTECRSKENHYWLVRMWILLNILSVLYFLCGKSCGMMSPYWYIFFHTNLIVSGAATCKFRSFFLT